MANSVVSSIRDSHTVNVDTGTHMFFSCGFLIIFGSQIICFVAIWEKARFLVLGKRMFVLQLQVKNQFKKAPFMVLINQILTEGRH